MSKERIVGFRVSDVLYEKLHEKAMQQQTSISEILRGIVMDNLDLSFQYSQWEIHAWNLFNTNADQVKYALRASKMPEQFFSLMAKWSKDTKISIIAHPQLVLIDFNYKGKSYLIQESRILPKIQVIQSIVDQLQEQIAAEVEREAESLCNGAFGGNISSAGEKQSDESGSDLQESSGSEGHSSMSGSDESGVD